MAARTEVSPPKSLLARLCRQNKSYREMAEILGVAKSTVGWLLHKHGLRTDQSAQHNSVKKPKCKTCGTRNVKLFYYGRKSVCTRCWAKNDKSYKNPRRKERRTMLKYAAVQAKGGCCQRCGYRQNLAALQFHHPNQNEKHEQWHKLFNNASRSAKQVKILAAELEKCELLCANCHAEAHYPDTNMPMCLTGKPLADLALWVTNLRKFFHQPVTV